MDARFALADAGVRKEHPTIPISASLRLCANRLESRFRYSNVPRRIITATVK